MNPRHTERLVELAFTLPKFVPEPVARGLMKLVADIGWKMRDGGQIQLEKNLARVCPNLTSKQIRRLSRHSMRSYMRYYQEAFYLSTYSREVIEARVRVVGLPKVLEMAANNENLVLALAHMGNWDLVGAWATKAVAPVTTVMEHLKPEALFLKFLGMRESAGMTLIPLDSGHQVFRQMLAAALAPGPQVLPLLADRDLSAGGVEVDLFGQKARVAAGPAALAISSGQPLIPLSIYYERLTGERRKAAKSPWGVVVEFHPQIASPTNGEKRQRVAELTQKWIDVLAGEIKAHPQDWHMLAKLFVEDLDPAKDAEIRAGSA